MKLLYSSLFVGVLFLSGCNMTNGDNAVETNAMEHDSTETIGDILKRNAEEFKVKHNISLDSKDVQFDMVNNLGKEFLIEGYAQLDDYFNYGFTNEKGYFATRITPEDGNDHWYVYFERKSSERLFAELKKNEKISVYIIGVIPKNVYKQGQGNMALGVYSEYR